MKRWRQRINNMPPKNKSIVKVITVLVLTIFFTTIVSAAVSKHDTVPPHNPLQEEASEISDVRLVDGYKDLIDEDNSLEADGETDDSDPAERDKEHHDDENNHNDHNNADHQNESHKDNSEDGDSKGDGGSNGGSSDASNLEVTDKHDSNKNKYFTTSIADGEVVIKPEYSFTITQLEHDFYVTDINVTSSSKQTKIDSVTGDQEEQVHVQSLLTKGENQVRVSVTYEDEENETFTVSQDYTVHLTEDNILIHTDLENKRVHKEQLIFKASAEKEEKSLPVQVTVNEEDITSETDKYKATLVEGDNKLVIKAQAGKDTVTEEFTIHYHQPNITIQTDLEDQTVKQPEFSFSAKAFDEEEEVNLSVRHNGENVDTNDSNYSITLKEDENTIELYAEKGSQSSRETYSIHYTSNPPEGGEDENDEHAPTIEIHDLNDGQTLKGTTKTFHVSAKDYQGEFISSIGVTNNEEHVNYNWTNKNQTSFTLDVQDGENNIVVTATDEEGNAATTSLTVHGDISDGVVGHATISVEATTVGLGHIIPEEQVEIQQGENGADVIDRLFEQHGITYDYTGSHANSFYLEAMYREGLVTNPVIPDDLLELLERDFDRADPEDYRQDSLGEFDFSTGAGWMYSVNGNYPNVGFADYYFEEGDVVRIRFTLAYGADIGGGMPGTNYGKEW